MRFAQCCAALQALSTALQAERHAFLTAGLQKGGRLPSETPSPPAAVAFLLGSVVVCAFMGMAYKPKGL
jgi:hypothetical protein